MKKTENKKTESKLPRSPYLAAMTTRSGVPMTDAGIAAYVARQIGPGRVEPDDAALGLWLVDLSSELRRALREDGAVDVTVQIPRDEGSVRVVAEMP